MKKQNTFKRPHITYEPIKQDKLPLWMHSIEKTTHGDTDDAGRSILFLLAIVAVVVLLTYIFFSNGAN